VVTLAIETSINKFIELFLKKEGVDRCDWEYDWVADRVAGIVNIGDNFFALEDVILDMKTKQPSGNIFNWQDSITDMSIKDSNFKYQSYNTWITNGNKLLEI